MQLTYTHCVAPPVMTLGQFSNLPNSSDFTLINWATGLGIVVSALQHFIHMMNNRLDVDAT